MLQEAKYTLDCSVVFMQTTYVREREGAEQLTAEKAIWQRQHPHTEKLQTLLMYVALPHLVLGGPPPVPAQGTHVYVCMNNT